MNPRSVGLRPTPAGLCPAIASFALLCRPEAYTTTLILIIVLLSACSRQTTHAADKKLIVLGVDGMDPIFLEQHWASLPNLSRLRTEGDFKRLGTTVPPQSPVAWATVTTGLDPGGHGLFDFVHRNPQTRTPMTSMSEVTAPARTLSIGPYVLPLSSGEVKSNRAGRAFWQTLAEHGVPAEVIRMPANFPAVECEQESLSGMGTPDMRGTAHTYTFFTNDPGENPTKPSGGELVRVEVKRGRAVLPIQGPPNTLRKDHAITSVNLTVDIDPTENVARLAFDNRQWVVRQGEWSDWVHASFPLITGLKSAAGMFRIHLQQVHPYLRVYVSPVQIDPGDPALPISTPASFSRTLSDAVGPFYTEGIAEETGAFRAGLFSKDEFLGQSHKILSDSLRLFHRELDRFQGGLLFYYFSSVDQNAHMLWGKYDDDLLEIYKGIDGAVGDAMAKAAATGAKLVVMSDHGFARFDRAVHLNTFLMQQGFLTLDDPANTGDDELFAHVDWGRTVAYAVGLNGLYLNLEGREDGGIVPAVDRQVILDRIAARLKEFKDPANGEKVVETVYFPETAFQGKNLKYSPDIIVGYRRGYRASWQTALGAVPKMTVEDNTQAWIGDHCMAAHLVPGVILTNRKMSKSDPQLYDIPSTVLSEFGVANGPGMLGKSVF
jgi:predicted AlkP superfamily phosphohydrolase/phosphomutase